MIVRQRRVGIARLAELVPPPPDALDGEGPGVGIDADTDPAMVGGNVIDAIRRHLAEFRDLEIMHPDLLGIALAAQLAAIVLEVANQLLLLGVHRDRRFARGNRCLHRRIDVLELRIAVRVIGPLARLAVGLATVVHLAQQVCHHPLARLEPLLRQRFDQMPLAAADPAQRRARIAADGVLDQRLECRRQARLMRHGGFAPRSRPAHPLTTSLRAEQTSRMPRLIVLRARPVTADTAMTPP